MNMLVYPRSIKVRDDRNFRSIAELGNDGFNVGTEKLFTRFIESAGAFFERVVPREKLANRAHDLERWRGYQQRGEDGMVPPKLDGNRQRDSITCPPSRGQKYLLLQTNVAKQASPEGRI